MAAIDFYSGGILTGTSFALEQESNVLRTEMTAGPAKQAKRLAKNRTIYNVNYFYTAAELIAFRSWFNNTASSGAAFFNWDDPTDDVTKDARIVNGSFQAAPANGLMKHYNVSMQIEVYE